MESCARIQKNRDFIDMRIAHRHTSGKPQSVQYLFRRSEKTQTKPHHLLPHTPAPQKAFLSDLERETKMVVQYIYVYMQHICATESV